LERGRDVPQGARERNRNLIEGVFGARRLCRLSRGGVLAYVGDQPLPEMTIEATAAANAHGLFDAGWMRQIGAGPSWGVSIHRPADAGRQRVEGFLEAAYARAFDSSLRRHFPVLLSVEDGSGTVQAAAGIRFARDHALYLEQYLDDPIEVAGAQALLQGVARDEIAEIGNLSSESPIASVRLFLAIAEYLAGEGCAYAAATATRQLRRKFGRMGFATCQLAEARASRLAPGADDWGRYYAREPAVLLGAIGPALDRLQMIVSAVGCAA
jgi:hypothetical protein